MGNKKILIIDDSETEIAILKKYLDEYQVVYSFSGEDGIVLASASVPDLIIVDLVMPGLNGFQVVQKLKADDVTKDIPIIMYTTKDGDFDKTWAFKQGVDDYLVKPVKKDLLLSKVKKIL